MDERAGRIEVIAGPMFAGKTEELLRRVRRAVIGGRRVEVFTHALDTRGQGRIASHAGLDFPSRAAPSAAVIAEQVKADTDLVAVDEAHFFGSDLVPVANELANRGLHRPRGRRRVPRTGPARLGDRHGTGARARGWIGEVSGALPPPLPRLRRRDPSTSMTLVMSSAA